MTIINRQFFVKTPALVKKQKVLEGFLKKSPGNLMIGGSRATITIIPGRHYITTPVFILLLCHCIFLLYCICVYNLLLILFSTYLIELIAVNFVLTLLINCCEFCTYLIKLIAVNYVLALLN